MTRREFGNALRRERERRKVTLKAIAERTKISATMLGDLERGECSRWPAGIYSRAWIRDYAQAIGLDPDQVSADFTHCFPEIAFPGQPEKKTAATTPPPSLRLTFDEAPQQRVRQATRRGFMFVLDTLAAVLVASLATLTDFVGFWTAVAACLVVVHAVGVIAGYGSAAEFALRLMQHGRTPDEEPARESAFAEAA